MGAIAAGKALEQGFVVGGEGVGLALRQGLQALTRRLPVGVHGLVVVLQLLHGGAHFGGAVVQQGREDVHLLVLMVQRRGDVEVAQHVARGLARRVVATIGVQVGGQPVQQAQGALHALVAGFEHFERRVKAHGGGAKAGQGGALCGHGVTRNAPARPAG